MKSLCRIFLLLGLLVFFSACEEDQEALSALRQDFAELYTNALGQNSSAQNEQGFATILTCRFPRSRIATASIDVFKFP
mgnify:CR=1 FL=1